MFYFESTGLWRSALADQKGDDDSTARSRSRLRDGFFRFRERAGCLADEIIRSYPSLTVHGITHLDALWEVADQIAGANYQITPAEAFVLGGAFLVHDLGNGVAAYPGGEQQIRQIPEWRQALAMRIRQRMERPPSDTEMSNPPPDLVKGALEDTLRSLHAKHAEELPQNTKWRDRDGNEFWLIEDFDIRKHYGRIIGLVAASHWWDIEEIQTRLRPEIHTTLDWMPLSWTVDAVKIACLLRVADAAHLDQRRAPPFLRALRDPSGSSDDHWRFQAKLGRPTLRGDRLLYTAGTPFAQQEADAFWLCFDALRVVDREIRGVNELLETTDRPDQVRRGFAARGVFGIEDARNLAQYVCTTGWAPVDVRVHVSNVPLLVERLGGKALYGDDRKVAVRELIQNAADAIRARRYLDDRDENWGAIIVRHGKDAEGIWLEVEDNGVGMSERVLTQHLLDFSAPFWNSDAMQSEYPSLAESTFSPSGRFGIGFFSVFMLGDRVRVTSRRYNDGYEKTRVLDFRSGISCRPILRMAEKDNLIKDGGTQVRVWLKEPFQGSNGLVAEGGTLATLCAWLCPSVDVDLHVAETDDKPRRVVAARDWITIPPEALLDRLSSDLKPLDATKRSRQAALLQELRDTTGQVIGRAGIAWDMDELGVVTAGGLRASSLGGINGILAGVPVTAARNTALPLVDSQELAQWASRQAQLITQFLSTVDADSQYSNRAHHVARVIWACGGDTGELPVARHNDRFLSCESIRNWPDIPTEIYLVGEGMSVLGGRGIIMFTANVMSYWPFKGEPVETSNKTLVYNAAMLSSGLVPTANGVLPWPAPRSIEYRMALLDWGTSLQGAIIDALAKAWSSSPVDVLRSSYFAETTEIGTLAGEPAFAPAMVLRNPKVSRPID